MLHPAGGGGEWGFTTLPLIVYTTCMSILQPHTTTASLFRPLLLLDFDGVCHSYQSGWQGPTVIPDPPVPGLFEFLTQASKVFDIQIYSARSSQPGGPQAMYEWFSRWYSQWFSQLPPDTAMAVWPSHPNGESLPERLSFPTTKPSAWLTIDDRAVCFTGQWPQVEELLDFKPWYKK